MASGEQWTQEEQGFRGNMYKTLTATKKRNSCSRMSRTFLAGNMYGKKDPIVHVRVRWITETPKGPVCTDENIIAELALRTTWF